MGSLKEQLWKFSEIISKSFNKPKQRLIMDMLYGIRSSNVKLCNILRTLKEDQSLIKLIKMEDQLSRNLDDEDFNDVMNQEIVRLGVWKIIEDMVIAIDPGNC